MTDKGKRKITPWHVFYDKPPEDKPKKNKYETGIKDYEF